VGLLSLFKEFNVKETLTCGMLALEAKQSGGKLLHHSDLRGEVFLGGKSRRIQRELKIGTWNVRSIYGAGSLKAVARQLARYKLDVVVCRRSGWTKGAH